MKSGNIYGQLKYVSEKFNSINQSDTQEVENVFKDLLCCEMDTMRLYDEIKGEILKIYHEELTDEEFRKKMDVIIKKMIGN